MDLKFKLNIILMDSVALVVWNAFYMGEARRSRRGLVTSDAFIGQVPMGTPINTTSDHKKYTFKYKIIPRKVTEHI